MQATFGGVFLKTIRYIFPRRCVICDRPLLAGEDGVCRYCEDARPVPIGGIRCLKCSKPIRDERTEYCRDCASGLHCYERGVALYEYGAVRESILRFKNAGRPGYGEWFAGEILRLNGDELRSFGAEALVPIPLSPARERKRGYNQAAILAGTLSKGLSMPVREDLLRRLNTGREQKSLSAGGRRNNSINSFISKQNDVKLKSVILVDDVYTTGSTMDAASAALLEGGAEHVYFVTLAIGNPDGLS